jgi:hypothetical protein
MAEAKTPTKSTKPAEPDEPAPAAPSQVRPTVQFPDNQIDPAVYDTPEYRETHGDDHPAGRNTGDF